MAIVSRVAKDNTDRNELEDENLSKLDAPFLWRVHAVDRLIGVETELAELRQDSSVPAEESNSQPELRVIKELQVHVVQLLIPPPALARVVEVPTFPAVEVAVLFADPGLREEEYVRRSPRGRHSSLNAS